MPEVEDVDYLLCPIPDCPTSERHFQSLKPHFYQAHFMSEDDIKEFIKTHPDVKLISDKSRKNYSEATTGDKNPQWKGDDASYSSLHEWISNHKPKPLLCEICGEKKKLELANISGEYKRDTNDFRWVCHQCNCNMQIPAHPRFEGE